MASDPATQANPFLGVVLHAIGGLAAASFYIPYKRVRNWSWETYWLVGGVFSWIIAPWIIALIIVPNTVTALTQADGKTLFWTYFFGVMWGVGGLTFGLTMRYLGIALGYAIALGFCAAFGTLAPPVYGGEIGRIINTTSGQIVLLGVAVCLVGIAASGVAGIWCLALNFKNRTGGEYFADNSLTSKQAPLGANYLLCAVAGIVWYFQFFFYSMGTTKMGQYDFSSWTLHMATIIIFSTLWGVALKEWRGASARTHFWIGVGLVVLIASTIVVGYGNYLGVNSGGH